METFIIIFIIAILFVVGSAGMMRFFDKKHEINKESKPDDSGS